MGLEKFVRILNMKVLLQYKNTTFISDTHLRGISEEFEMLLPPLFHKEKAHYLIC